MNIQLDFGELYYENLVFHEYFILKLRAFMYSLLHCNYMDLSVGNIVSHNFVDKVLAKTYGNISFPKNLGF